MMGTILILDRLCDLPYQQTAILYHPELSYKVTIRGQVSDAPYQFAINISDETGAVLMHINPRWFEKRFVVNCCTTKSWGREEYAPLNLKANEPFDIGITDKGDFFWVTINNEVEIAFQKRIKPASALRVVGVCKVERDDIYLSSVQMDEFLD